jgi:NADPH:quinone reductase-like Zn-dependent oxidoreductase
MKAVVYDRYGPPDVLRIESLPMPSPAAGRCSSGLRRRRSISATGRPCAAHRCIRASVGRAPARRTLGSDIAGWVDAVGSGVTRVRPGDEVYGDNLALKGEFAEYAIAPESVLATRPSGLTLVEASTIPQAGVIAWQETDGTEAGHRVLVNGAGGSSGSFAIQLAKRLGAHVTGVDNAGKLDFMRSLGADEVIDYGSEDFTRGPS